MTTLPQFDSLGGRVLVRDIPAAADAGGIAMPEDTRRKVTAIGVVVSAPESGRVAPGDLVLYRKYAADLFHRGNGKDKETFASLHEEDLLVRLDPEEDLSAINVSGFATHDLNVYRSQLAMENRQDLIARQAARRRELVERMTAASRPRSRADL